MNTKDEKQVKAYFLGDLADDDVLQIEMRFFDDESFARQAQAVEEELIENYLDGNLTDEESRRFAENYLVTSARRLRLEFVRNLKNGKLADTKQPAPLAALPKSKKPLIAGASQWWNRFWSPQLKFGFAFGCGLLLLVLCAGVFRFFTHPTATTSVERSDSGGKNSGASETNIASSSQTVNLPPQSTAQTAASPEIQTDSGEQSKAAKPLNKTVQPKKVELVNSARESQQQPNKTEPQQPAILATTLLPGVLRSSATEPQYVYYSPAEKFTIVNLSGVEIQSSRVIVELQTAESETLWQQSNVKVQRTGKGKKTVAVAIPREVLSERTFVAVLYENQEPIAEYIFQAKRK